MIATYTIHEEEAKTYRETYQIKAFNPQVTIPVQMMM